MSADKLGFEATDESQSIVCNLTKLLIDRKMTLSKLSELAGISIVNLSVLKNGHARAIRFSTLSAICKVLECEVGELLAVNTTNAE